MQDFAVVRFESTALGDATVQVRSLHGTERISQLFEFELHIVVASTAGLGPAALMSSPASIVVLRATTEEGQPREERRIFGIISHVTDRISIGASHTEYLLTFVPRAWVSTLTCLNDIFMDMTVPEIIEKKLTENCNLEPGKDFELRLLATYPKREFVVQYQETDLAFMSRLAEDQGICFFFEHHDGRDVMVFSDDNSGFQPAEPESLALATRGAEIGVFDLVSEHRQVTTTFRTRDYNYRNPGVDVLGEAQSGVLGAGLVEEFGVHAKNPDEATRLARVRVEEETCRHQVYRGKGEASGLRAGSVVKLEGHARGDLDLIVVEVNHHANQAVLGGSGGSAAENDYTNEFRAIPKTLVFRPARITPKPVVPGVVTGVIQSSSDKEMGAIDDQGRYRVAFMYDSVKTREEAKASRPLRMAQPSAGPDRGFHLPLKAGVEVLVTCVNGDPDRPIISGAVPNPQTSSPVTAANSEKSGMRTNKSQWFIDDREPRFKLEVNGNEHVFQVGCPNGPELGFYTASVSNYTSSFKGMSTSVGAGLSAVNKWKSQNVQNDIVEVAGKTEPLSKLERLIVIYEVAMATWETAQAGFAAASKKSAIFDERATKREEEKLAAKRNALAAKITKPDPADPAKKVALTYENDRKKVEKENPDGTKSYVWETRTEFEQRVLKENASQLSPAEQDELKAANQSVADASKTAADNKKAWAEADWNISEGPAKEVTEAVSATAAALKAGKELISTMGKLWGKVHIAKEYVAAVAKYNLCQRTVARASKQRVTVDVGQFLQACNIKGAKGSVGLIADQTAFLYGSKGLQIASPVNVSAVAGNTMHVKAGKTLEVAANLALKITAEKDLDVYSRTNAWFVAHKSEQKMPGSHNMLLASEKHMKLISDTQLHASAADTIAVVSGKDAGTGMLACPDSTFIGLIESGASTSKSRPKETNGMAVKQDEVTIKAAESELSVKKGITGTAKNAVMFKAGKSIQFDADGSILAKSKKCWEAKADKTISIKASSNCTIKGSKVMIG